MLVRVAVVGAGVVGLSVSAALIAAGQDVECYEPGGPLMGERSAGSTRIDHTINIAGTDDMIRPSIALGAGNS